MDIWIRWTMKRVKCSYCEKPILSRTPQVVGKMWKGRMGKPFTLWKYWHPKCYIKQGIARLRKLGLPDKRRLILTEEQRKVRTRLLRRWATNKIRLRERLSCGKNTERLVLRLLEIKREIETVGGVPKKWNPGNAPPPPQEPITG